MKSFHKKVKFLHFGFMKLMDFTFWLGFELKGIKCKINTSTKMLNESIYFQEIKNSGTVVKQVNSKKKLLNTKKNK